MLQLVYFVSDIVSRIAAIVSIAAVIGYICKAINQKTNNQALSFTGWLLDIQKGMQSFANYFLGPAFTPALFLALACTIISSTVVHQAVGIFHLETLPNGIYCFYVEATPSKGNTYVLPGQIEIYDESIDLGDSQETRRLYFIEAVYFPDGKRIDADDGEADYIDKPSYIYDENETEWKLTLMNKHAYSPYIEETNNATWFDITFFVLQLSVYSLLICAWFCKDPQKSTSS